MNKIFILIITLIIIGFVACKPKKESTNDGVIEIDVRAALKNKRKVKMSEIFKDVELISLESGPDSYIRHATNLDIGNKYILVNGSNHNNQYLVYLFSRSGKFLRRIGKIGKGPGEYIEPRAIALNEEVSRIIVSDGPKRTLMIYDLDGNLLNKKSIKDVAKTGSVIAIEFIDNKHFVIEMSSPKMVSHDYAKLLVYDLELNLESKLFEETKEEYHRYGESNLCQCPNGMYFWTQRNDTLCYINNDGSPKPAYFINTQNNEKPTNQRIGFGTVNDLGNYILFFGGEYLYIYDKIKNETFLVDNTLDCATNAPPGWAFLENDLFGLEPLIMGYYHSKPNALDFRINTLWFSDWIDLECLGSKTVLNNKARDEIINILQNPDDVSYVIGLLYLN